LVKDLCRDIRGGLRRSTRQGRDFGVTRRKDESMIREAETEFSEKTMPPLKS